MSLIDKIISKAFYFLVKFYQYTFAAVLGGQCRFYPSCSAYALEYIKVHGGVRAALPIFWRILRCHPYSQGGNDPVPKCPSSACSCK